MVGTAVRKELSTSGHQLRLLDVAPVREPEGEVVQGSILDYEAVYEATKGMDGVIHLAYGSGKTNPRGSEARGDDWSFDVNVKGTYNVMRAALENKLRRAVYASTLSVFDGMKIERGLYGGVVLSEETPPFPCEVYGFTKYLGEEVCRYFAKAHGLSCVVLRLTGVTRPEDWSRAGGGSTSTTDVARAFRMALEKDGISFEILHICGDNVGRPTEIGKARRVLGFWPRDKAPVT